MNALWTHISPTLPAFCETQTLARRLCLSVKVLLFYSDLFIVILFCICLGFFQTGPLSILNFLKTGTAAYDKFSKVFSMLLVPCWLWLSFTSPDGPTTLIQFALENTMPHNLMICVANTIFFYFSANRQSRRHHFGEITLFWHTVRLCVQPDTQGGQVGIGMSDGRTGASRNLLSDYAACRIDYL